MRDDLGQRKSDTWVCGLTFINVCKTCGHAGFSNKFTKQCLVFVCLPRSVSVCSSVLSRWGALWATLKHLVSRPCPCQHGAVRYPSPSRQRHFLEEGSSVAFATLQIHSINPNYTPPKSPLPTLPHSTNKWSESVKHLLCASSQWLWR